MSKKIEIEVPEEYYRLLETVAARKGVSVPDLIVEELGLTKKGLSFEELDARVKASGPGGGSAAETTQIIREMRGD